MDLKEVLKRCDSRIRITIRDTQDDKYIIEDYVEDLPAIRIIDYINGEVGKIGTSETGNLRVAVTKEES